MRSSRFALLIQVAGLLVSLPLLSCLSDASSFDPSSVYERADKLFIHGDLGAAKREAEIGYRRSLNSDVDWSRKFQVLEATAMLWAGDDQELLQLLVQRPISSATDRDLDIEQASIEATALIHLGKLRDAELKLNQGDDLCAHSASDQCGAVLRAHALLLLNQGHLVLAKAAYLKALTFARAHHDRIFEGTVLLNLGTTLSAQEHHDDALSYEEQAYRLAIDLGAQDLALTALGNEGSEFYSMGNAEKALELYMLSLKQAIALGDKDSETWLLTVAAKVYADTGALASAESFDLRAVRLARKINRNEKVMNASEDLAQLYVSEGKADQANQYAGDALALAQLSSSQPDILYCHMLQGQAAALRHDWVHADILLHEVALAPESQDRMRWNAHHTLAAMYEAQGKTVEAAQSYENAIKLVEAARTEIKQERSQLTFLNNAARIYDDYIHFLVSQGRTDQALEVADWSRARTLQQGIVVTNNTPSQPQPLHATEIARSSNTTLLFYWLGAHQSYVWAVTPEKTIMVPLPAKDEIVFRMERYRRAIVALKDPLRANGGRGDTDGRELYQMLVAPVAMFLSADRPVVLFTDGEMTQLNLETLLSTTPAPHYWIEDVTLSSSPSLRVFAMKKIANNSAQARILVFGDPVSADPAFANLPMAAVEIDKIKGNFRSDDELLFSGKRATPSNYLESKPEQFAYIHFVAHATASTTDPLESAVILSRDGADYDSYKLYAREIVKHPITARLVTISACNSSGAKSYAGEGIIGLSWAFLRAGAHNTIGALWEVSDASTPELMGHLYAGLEQQQPPASALRNAKLALLHSGDFNRPFYWAPFQLYSGR